MIENLNIYIVIITLLIIIIIYINFNQANVYNKLISGFYNADESFCEESDIDTFCIYIDDDIDSSGSRACYILMKSGDELLLNEPATLKLNQHLSWSSNPSQPRYFDVEFANISDSAVEFFPLQQTIRFYPITGKIVLYYEDTVFGVFYKSGVETELKTVLDDVQI